MWLDFGEASDEVLLYWGKQAGPQREEAVAHLVRRHQAALWSVARRQLSREDAEEVVSFTFCQAVKYADRWKRERGSVRTWMMGILAKAVGQRHRENSRQRRLSSKFKLHQEGLRVVLRRPAPPCEADPVFKRGSPRFASLYDLLSNLDPAFRRALLRGSDGLGVAGRQRMCRVRNKVAPLMEIRAGQRRRSYLIARKIELATVQGLFPEDWWT